MIKSYFTIAIRNFWRHKIFSAINVLGLAIGTSASLVIFMIVYYEFSFDGFEKDKERIYRVLLEINDKGRMNYSAAVPAPLTAAAQNEVTGLEQVVPVYQFQGDATIPVSVVKNNPNKPVVFKHQPDVIFTNRSYFETLSYTWLAGSPATALRDPFAVVLTESRAQQYFPNTPAANIIGQQLIYGDSLKTTVTGVVKDLDEHTYFTCAEFISFATIQETKLKHDFMMDTWTDWMAYTQVFVKLSKANNTASAEASLTSLLRKYNKYSAGNENNFKMSFKLQPLSDVHFNYGAVGKRTADKKTLFGLLAVAFFLLMLGCINFINLTTAQGAERAKEIGIRKTMGSGKRQLVIQFLSETFLITCIATILSVIIAPFLLRMFADFIPSGLHFDLLHQPYVFIFLMSITLAVSLLSGFYPALVLSGYNPVLVLKNQVITSDHTRKAWLRKSLIVSQFVIAQFFVIATILVSKQINYALNKDLGFKKDAIVYFSVPRDTSVSNKYLLLQKIKAIPQVEKASMGFMPPASSGPAYTNVKFNNGKEDIKADVQIRWGDTAFLDLYSIKLLCGRNVRESDTAREFVINEKYSKIMGFQHPEDALGKMLDFNGQKLPVVGVMQDFHEGSLRSGIDPIVFTAINQRSGFFHIALLPQNAEGTSWRTALTQLEELFKEVYPKADFNYSFFDESIAAFYKNEENTARLLRWATALTIFISCLGLAGLAIYTSNTRTKEIGIRKTLGASVVNIVALLSKDFVRLVTLAFLVAAPLAWWAMHNWLQDFVYRTEMSWWVFVLSGMAMLFIALIILSFQVIKTAIANPVESLRTE